MTSSDCHFPGAAVDAVVPTQRLVVGPALDMKPLFIVLFRVPTKGGEGEGSGPFRSVFHVVFGLYFLRRNAGKPGSRTCTTLLAAVEP